VKQRHDAKAMPKQRVRTWWLLFVSAAITSYMAWYLIPLVHCYWTGKTVEGEIVKYVPRKDNEGSTIHEYIVAFDGHQVVRRFHRQREIGEKFPVTYRVGVTTSMIKGSRRDSFPSVIRQNLNPYVLAIPLVFGALTFVTGMGWVRGNTINHTKPD
jgi:hypothetical protein